LGTLLSRAALQPLLPEAALSALQHFFDGEFGIQHGVGPCKGDASLRSGCIEKDDPFPATRICRLNDFKLDGFVFHGRSSKRPAQEVQALPRNERRLHVQSALCEVCHPPSPTLRSQASQIRKAAARQFFWISFTCFPFSAEVPLKRATTRISGVDIIVRQVKVPRSLHSKLQRRIVFHL
jgi:hypothetical protein